MHSDTALMQCALIQNVAVVSVLYINPVNINICNNH